jgi:hypothetical protein
VRALPDSAGTISERHHSNLDPNDPEVIYYKLLKRCFLFGHSAAR